jgi:hypothetical protein
MEYGAKWFQTILDKLEEASAVVCLLTPQSISRPWLLYEAGVAAGKADTPVKGLVLGLSIDRASQGPFAQLQLCAFDALRITGLITELIKKLTPAAPGSDTVRPFVEAFLAAVDPYVQVDGDQRAAEADHEGALGPTLVAQMLEEVKEVVVGLPQRLCKAVSESDISNMVDQLGVAVQDARAIQEATRKTFEADAQKLHDRVEEIHAILTSQLGRIPAIPALQKCGIINIHEDRPLAEMHILDLLRNAKKHVEVAGISLRGLFQGGGRLNRTILDTLHSAAKDRAGELRWRVLVLDPESDQARYRTEREEPETTLREATLCREVLVTVEMVAHLKRKGCPIDLKAYRGSPSCFLLIIDDTILVEQYHYGRAGGARVAELVPLFEYSSESTTYKELSGHFDYMWERLSRPLPSGERTNS